jgi:predicted DCC family thiol-disulfide oxidoreductase YuxK
MTTQRQHIFYDGRCGLCSAGARRWQRVLALRGWTFTAMQTPWVRHRLGLGEGESAADEIAIVTAEDRVLHGVEALLHVAGTVWWLWPVYLAGQVAPIRRMLGWGYGLVARNRYRIGGRCELKGDGT